MSRPSATAPSAAVVVALGILTAACSGGGLRAALRARPSSPGPGSPAATTAGTRSGVSTTTPVAAAPGASASTAGPLAANQADQADHADQPEQPGQPDQVVTHQISPDTTDPSIVGPDDPNLALVGPPPSWNGRLVVFLPGTGGQPGCCRMFLTEAATLGFHAVGLTYNNTVAVGTKCTNNLACYGQVRHNVFDGSDPSAYSAVPPTDGVEHRLTALLTYLARAYPAEGWATFLASGAPDYAKIVGTGHSQGGGEAAFIGTVRRLAGVVSLSSPPDTNDQDEAAPWLFTVRTGATPPTAYYAFVHQGDPFGARIRSDWTAMGLDALGPLTSVDATGPPYGGSHELFSSAPVPTVVLADHDSTAVDNAQPLCPDGRSRYIPTWADLLQGAAGLPVTASQPGCAAA